MHTVEGSQGDPGGPLESTEAQPLFNSIRVKNESPK